MFIDIEKTDFALRIMTFFKMRVEVFYLLGGMGKGSMELKKPCILTQRFHGIVETSEHQFLK
jgi:hypothetical protein